MKTTNGIYEGINTLDELIYALNQLKKEYGAKTKVVGSSIINMGMGDNGFDEFDNTINLCVNGKCDFLQ